MTTLFKGRVQNYFQNKGFGFISPDDDKLAAQHGARHEEDQVFFFHFSEVLAVGDGRLSIEEGTEVFFQPQEASRGQRPRAIRVQLVDGAFTRTGRPPLQQDAGKPARKTVKRPRISERFQEGAQLQNDEERIKRIVHQSLMAVLSQPGGGACPPFLGHQSAVSSQQSNPPHFSVPAPAPVPAPVPFPGVYFGAGGFSGALPTQNASDPMVTVPLSYVRRPFLSTNKT